MTSNNIVLTDMESVNTDVTLNLVGDKSCFKPASVNLLCYPVLKICSFSLNNELVVIAWWISV